jgi:hypothetical protein
MSKYNGGEAVLKIIKILKPVAYHIGASKSLKQQLKMTFVYNYTSITWAGTQFTYRRYRYNEQNDSIYKAPLSFCIIGIKLKCTRQCDENLPCRKREKKIIYHLNPSGNYTYHLM